MKPRLRRLLLEDVLGMVPQDDPARSEIDAEVPELRRQAPSRNSLERLGTAGLALLTVGAGFALAAVAYSSTLPGVASGAGGPYTTGAPGHMTMSPADAAARAGIHARVLAGYPGAKLVSSAYVAPPVKQAKPAVSLVYEVPVGRIQLAESPGTMVPTRLKPDAPVHGATETIGGSDYWVIRNSDERVLLIGWATPDGVVIYLTPQPALDTATAARLLAAIVPS